MERVTDEVRRFIYLAAFLPFLSAASLDADAMLDERRQIALSIQLGLEQTVALQLEQNSNSKSGPETLKAGRQIDEETKVLRTTAEQENGATSTAAN